MSWVTVGLAVAGAYMGSQKNQRAQEIEDADTKLQGELTRYGWVDGAQKGNPNAIRKAGSMFGDVGQGALSGAMFGSQFNKPAQSPSGGMSGEAGYQNQDWYKKLLSQNQNQTPGNGYTF